MATFARSGWGVAWGALLLALVNCSAEEKDPLDGRAGNAGMSGSPAGNGGSIARGGSASGRAGATQAGTAGTSSSGVGGAAQAGKGGAPAAGAGGSGGEALRGGSGGAASSAGDNGAGSGGSADGGSAGTGAAMPGACQPACGSHKWACWPMPNPVGSGLPNEAVYTDGEDVVRDELTCLEWQKAPPSTTYVWQDAIDYCEALDLGGHDDWRLPTRIELTSIVDFTKGPALDPSAFPGAAGGFHKTASDWILTIEQRGAGAGRDFAWAFNLSDGIVSNAYSKAEAARLRCVRGGGAGEAPSEPAVAPPDLYSVIADGEVRDNYTGLVWQREDSEAQLTWEEAGEYCANLGLNGESWRLPSVRELATLVDEATVGPAIDREMFPDTQYGARSNDWYWASHRQRGSMTAAWALNYDDGFTGFNAGASGAWNYFTAGWVRCVR